MRRSQHGIWRREAFRFSGSVQGAITCAVESGETPCEQDRDVLRLIIVSHFAVTGLENGVGTLLIANRAIAYAGLTTTFPAPLVALREHATRGPGPTRALMYPDCALMTDPRPTLPKRPTESGRRPLFLPSASRQTRDRITDTSSQYRNPPRARRHHPDRYTPSWAAPIPRRPNVAHASRPPELMGDTRMKKSHITSRTVSSVITCNDIIRQLRSTNNPNTPTC